MHRLSVPSGMRGVLKEGVDVVTAGPVLDDDVGMVVVGGVRGIEADRGLREDVFLIGYLCQHGLQVVTLRCVELAQTNLGAALEVGEVVGSQ